MTRLLLQISFWFVSFSALAQTTRQELTLTEIKYLATDFKSKLEPSDTDFSKALENRLVGFEFAIIYNNKVLYVGTINKPTYTTQSYHNIRRYASFFLAYDSLDTGTKLEILENNKLNLLKTETEKKYFWIDNYELFRFNVLTNELELNDHITSKLRIKFYKIIN